MHIRDPHHLYATIHDFKNNISKYIRMLERRQYRAVVVQRRDKIVGIFIPYEARVQEIKSGLEPYGNKDGFVPPVG